MVKLRNRVGPTCESIMPYKHESLYIHEVIDFRLSDEERADIVQQAFDIYRAVEGRKDHILLNGMINDLFAPQGNIDGNEPTGDLLVTVELPQVLCKQLPRRRWIPTDWRL